MRHILFPVFAAVVFQSTVLPPPVLSAGTASRVDRVVLYPDAAEVTRVVEVDPPAGSIVLTGLTPNLLPDSLAAKVLAGGARIAGISSGDVFRTEPADERVSELVRKIEEWTDGKRRAEGALVDFRREKQLLESGVAAVFAPDGGKERPRLTAGEIESALALFGARVQAVDAKIFDLERDVRETDKRIAAARQELDRIRNPRPTQEKTVRIDLDRSAKCRVAVTYLVSAAGFVPRYNVRLAPGTGELSFELVGEAWQRTGEEWKDAALTFSTARPGRMAQLPPHPPWILDFRQPPIVRPMTEMGAMAKSAARADAPAPAGTEEKDVAEAPVPERRFASFEVTLDGTHSVPGNGERKSFLLSRREQKAKVAWRAIPRVTDGAFIAADGKNDTGLPLFAAPAGLFLEEAYVGKGGLPDLPEGEEFGIDFGKDPGVKVERREIRRGREEGGVFSKVKRVRFRYEITARNFRKETVPLAVRDRYPVSRHKDILVKEIGIEGGGKTNDKEPGEVTWEFPLAPGEKRTLGLSFTVEYPADREIDEL